MTDEENTGKEEENGKVDSAPIGKTQPVDPSSPAITGAGAQEQVTTKSGNEKSKDKCDKSKEILVRVLEDDELKPFESQTLSWARAGFYLALATLIIAVLTLAIFYRQLNVMQIQLQDAETDSRISDLRARQQHQTAKDQVDAIKRQMRQDQRAWISAASETVGIQGIPAVGQPFVIRTIFKNIGKSAALHLRTCTGADFLPKEQISDFKCPGGIKHFVNSGTMFPGSANFVDLPITLAIQSGDRDKILSNNWNMWVYGRVEYTDVFGVPHWSNFCSHLLSGGGYAICDKHTETDENY